MDWRLPGISGVQATEAIRDEIPRPAWSSSRFTRARKISYRAVQAGVAAYLPKSAEREELLAAIRAVHWARPTFPRPLPPSSRLAQARPELSSREREVLHWVVLGRTNREIARQLGIAEVTVKVHVGNVLQKLEQATARKQRRWPSSAASSISNSKPEVLSKIGLATLDCSTRGIGGSLPKYN